MKTTFARHGESEANVGRWIANRGLADPLRATGRRRARELPGRHPADAHVVCVGHGGSSRVALPTRLASADGARLRAQSIAVCGTVVVHA